MSEERKGKMKFHDSKVARGYADGKDVQIDFEPSDLEGSREELLSHLDFVQNKCCENKPCDIQERTACWESHREVKRLIQQKPEIDEKYVEEKVKEMIKVVDVAGLSYLINDSDSEVIGMCKNFITQIIRDIQGKK